MTDIQHPKPDQPELTAALDKASAPKANENQAAEPVGETMPSLEQLLKKAELDAMEHHDAWLRAKADAENRLR